MTRHYTLWADKRLAEAYDLVDDVVRGHATASEGLSEIRAILAEIDRADRLLATLSEAERASSPFMPMSRADGATDARIL